jgi:hypothetical protein
MHQLKRRNRIAMHSLDGNINAYGVTMTFEVYCQIRAYDFLNACITRLGLVSRQTSNVSWARALDQYVDSVRRR